MGPKRRRRTVTEQTFSKIRIPIHTEVVPSLAICNGNELFDLIQTFILIKLVYSRIIKSVLFLWINRSEPRATCVIAALHDVVCSLACK